MKTTTKLSIAAAAMTGLLAGSAARSSAATDPGPRARPLAGRQEGHRRQGRRPRPCDDKTDKHDCKGKNDCKGKGGCKTGDNGCKGKNSCKGKGGCKAETPKL